jgi:hypothetical protein
MSAVAKSSRVGFDALSAMTCVKISELFAGEKLGLLSPVYIADSDGLVYAATDDSTNELNFDGFISRAIDSDMIGAPCTILSHGAIMEWLEDSDNVSPGTLLYVGATNALETTGTTAVAMTINSKEIICIAGPGLRAAVA